MSAEPEETELAKLGIEFESTGKRMKYVYPDSPHWSAGWILYWHEGQGDWVTLRKATNEDIAAINKAVISAHHGESR